jgi:membrane-associated phospholipid phosphatase
MTVDITVLALLIVAATFGASALLVHGRLALVMLAAALFTVLLTLALHVNAHWLTSLDDAVQTWLDAHRSHRWRVDASGWFSYLGRPFHVAAAGLVFGALLSLQARSAVRGLLVVGGVGAGVVGEQILKAVIWRTPETLAALHDGSLTDFAHSFPSGHVTGATTLLGMIAVCFGAGRSRAVQAGLAVPVVLGVLSVAFLALYSRAHIFSDVLGGMFLGGGIVALGAAVLAGRAKV